MSHFGVLVITDEKPTEDILEEILAPWHEFECTGMVNKYVQNIDELPEALELYNGDEIRLRAPDGSMYDPYDDQFYRDPTPEEEEEILPFGGMGFRNGLSYLSKDWGDGRGYRAKFNYVPEGWEKVGVPKKELYTFAEFVADYYERPILLNEPDLEDVHKWGWYRVGENGEVTELVRRTNPNAKWDWWTVGGRWSGFLAPKATAVDVEKGQPGLMGSQANPKGVDVAMKRDVDFEGMREDARVKARAEWQQIHDLVGHLLDEFLTWDYVRDEMFPEYIDEARKFYHSQPAMQELRKQEDLRWLSLEDFLCPLEEYETRRSNSCTTTFAFVKDGQWIERGNMGFWAVVTNEQDRDEWAKAFNQMLDELPEETWLTVVDCHI